MGESLDPFMNISYEIQLQPIAEILEVLNLMEVYLFEQILFCFNSIYFNGLEIILKINDYYRFLVEIKSFSSSGRELLENMATRYKMSTFDLIRY